MPLLKFDIVGQLSGLLQSKEHVLVWMAKNQLGRRNLTPKQASYLRGFRYNAEVKKFGAPEGNDNAKNNSEKISPLNQEGSTPKTTTAKEALLVVFDEDLYFEVVEE